MTGMWERAEQRVPYPRATVYVAVTTVAAALAAIVEALH